MGDLPDWYSAVETTLTKVTSIQHGLDADIPAAPSSGDAYVATDTKKFYACFADGTWTEAPERLDSVSQSQPARAAGVTYQNDSGKIRLVTITVATATPVLAACSVNCDTDSPPTMLIGTLSVHVTYNPANALTFIVPPDYYYKLTAGGVAGIQRWTEWELH